VPHLTTKRQLQLAVEIQTTDTGRRFRLSGLVDCGASGLFIDQDYVMRNRIPTKTLTRAIPVLNVDGTPNEAGAITQVVDLVLKYDNHTEQATFTVISLGSQDLILGLPWLRQHNPEIDWSRSEVRMTRCNPWCETCKIEIRQITKECQKGRRAFRKCRAGPTLNFTEEEGIEEEEERKGREEEPKEYGDRILATVLHPEPEQINAMATIFQRLAAAAGKMQESAAKTFKELVPSYLHEFKEVFNKTAFDMLLERKKWNHAVELIPQAIPRTYKVYPLSLNEQKELDAFLEENLCTRHICPLYSLLKRKTGDYTWYRITER
jgi:hypothetical protein